MSTRVVAMKEDVAFTAARRVNQALTASLERRALLWMASRAPRWVSSDGLTLLGLGAQIGAGIGYALARYDRRALLLVIVCMVLNWLGDSLDGTLARVRAAAEAALWVLCGSHGGRVWSGRADVRAGLLGAGALAGGDGDAGGVSAAVERELSGDVYAVAVSSCRRGCLGRRRFGFC